MMRLTLMGGIALAFSSPLDNDSMPRRLTGYVMDDSSIRTAVKAWFDDRSGAEATYGHISTWETGGVRDMSQLFWANFGSTAGSFDEDIGAWDTSGVTRMDSLFEGNRAFNQDIGGWAVHNVKSMKKMFYGASSFNRPLGDWRIDEVTQMIDTFREASSFDQDLGWCVRNGVDLKNTFIKSKCESNMCGVAKKDFIGLCEPWAPPCLIGESNNQVCMVNSPTLIIMIMLVLFAGFSACVHRRKKKDETYAAAARSFFCCCCCCRWLLLPVPPPVLLLPLLLLLLHEKGGKR